MQIGLNILSGAAVPPEHAESAAAPLDRVFLARAIGDLVPNAWLAFAFVEAVVARLRREGHAERRIAQSAALLVEQLRTDLEARRDALAEAVFAEHVRAGRIEFRLRADRLDYEIPHELLENLPDRPRPLFRPDGRPLERSLFDPIFESMLDNRFEADIACYLDTQAALSWWHRNVARSGYGLQGWRRNKIYPDFVFAKTERDGRAALVVLETKGVFLKNEDTEYKRRLLVALTEAFDDSRLVRGGELELVGDGGERIVCDLVFDENWTNTLNSRYFAI